MNLYSLHVLNTNGKIKHSNNKITYYVPSGEKRHQVASPLSHRLDCQECEWRLPESFHTKYSEHVLWSI